MRSLKVNCGYQCAFCMGKSMAPSTFSRRPIGNHAQLSPTPIGNHVQLFRDHAELRAALSPLTTLNFLTTPSFSVTVSPATKRAYPRIVHDTFCGMKSK